MSIYGGPYIITSGLVLHLDPSISKSYPGSGTTWFDLTERNNNATIINGVSYNSNNRGTFAFDGTNDYATVPGTNGLFLGNTANGTVCCWGRTNDTNTPFQTLVMWEDQADANNLEPIRLCINGTVAANALTKPGFYVINNSNSGAEALSVSNIVSSVYYYIVGTYNGSFIRLYINGVLDNQTSFSGNFKNPISGTSAKWIIGRGEVPNNDRLLKGNIAQVSVYNRALSASEILQNYNATKGRFGL